MAQERHEIIYSVTVQDQTGPGAAKAAAGLDRLGDEAQQVTSGLRALDTAMASSSRVSTSAATAWARLQAAADPVERSMQQIARAQATAERAIRQGIATEQEAARALDQLRQRYLGAAAANENFAATSGRVATSSRGAGAAVQQAGYQVGDFAVQIASGQDPLRAFIQQGTQMAGAFGMWGAVLGAAGAVLGVVVTELGLFSSATDDAAAASERLDTAIEGINTILSEHKRLGAELHTQRQTEATDIASLASHYAGLTETVRQYEITRLQAARVDLQMDAAAVQQQTAIATGNVRSLSEWVTAAAGSSDPAVRALAGVPGGAEMDAARDAARALADTFRDFNATGENTLETLQGIYAATGALVFDGGPLSSEAIAAAPEAARDAMQGLRDIARGTLDQLQQPTQQAARIVEQLDAANESLELMTMSPEDLQALADRMRAVADAAGSAGGAASGAADQVERLADAAARRELRLDDYIAGLDEANRLEQLSTQEKAVQEAILRAQALLVDEQGQAVRSLTAAERARIETAVQTTDAIRQQQQAIEATEKAIAGTVDDVVDYASKGFIEFGDDVLADPEIAADVAAALA